MHKYFHLCCVLVLALPSFAQVTVRFPEGSLHGFLTVRDANGEIIGSGDDIQNVRKDRVTARVTLRFKDGSVRDETAIFTQNRRFRLLSDHVVQKGPSFPDPIDATINASTGNVVIRPLTGEHAEQPKSEHMKLGPDLANGILPLLLKNLPEHAASEKLSMVATASKPRLVKLSITSEGPDHYLVGDAERKATHYVVKIELGGVAGAVAPLIGKKPADLHFWITEGEVPTFLKSEGPLYPEGPTWTIELASPTWPDQKKAQK